MTATTISNIEYTINLSIVDGNCNNKTAIPNFENMSIKLIPANTDIFS